MGAKRLLRLSYYFVLLPVWVGLIALMMLTSLNPMSSWLGVPFGLVLLLASAHLAFFHREHLGILRRFNPFVARSEVTLPLVAAGFGIVGAVLLVAGLNSL